MKKLLIILLFTSCAMVRPTYDNQIPFPSPMATEVRIPQRSPQEPVDPVPNDDAYQLRRSTDIFLGILIGIVVSILFFQIL